MNQVNNNNKLTHLKGKNRITLYLTESLNNSLRIEAEKNEIRLSEYIKSILIQRNKIFKQSEQDEF